jgi:glutathione peroxidase
MKFWQSILAMFGVATYTSGVGNLSALPETLYGFQVKDIDGREVKLDKYKGKVILVVNVASKCGLTPQYEGLEKLYKKYKDKGFVILGFPANEFAGQEPGSNAEIKQFCSMNYGVTFPMFSKIVVKGDGIHPLYQWLIAKSEKKNDIEWNFAKFLVGKDGKLKERFSPRMKPEAEELEKAIQNALNDR